jgi:ABC-type transport system involved in multi-copper enzyme maturation permease subunit
MVPIDAVFFKTFIDVQLTFAFAFTFILGSGLISRDLRHRAIVLFFTKPISAWEYFLGKFSVIFMFAMALLWLPATVLLMFQWAISPAESVWRVNFWRDYAWLFVAATAYATLASTCLSLLMLAASSLTKTAAAAGIGFAMFIMGGFVISRILQDIGPGIPGSFSILRAVMELGFYFFGMTRDREYTAASAWMGVVGNLVLFGLVIAWSLRRAARAGVAA